LVIKHQQARIAPRAGQDAVRLQTRMLPETRSEMALPLIVGDQVIGALTIQSAVEDAFTEMDITSLQGMADQLAIAIQNARTHAQAQRRADLLETCTGSTRLAPRPRPIVAPDS
jgi:GAF domain-containing protein